MSESSQPYCIHIEPATLCMAFYKFYYYIIIIIIN